MNPHISYKISKNLKEFLGDNAPVPLNNSVRWMDTQFLKKSSPYLLRDGNSKNGYNAYQLHDLLSKPFCEAMTGKGLGKRHFPFMSWYGVSKELYLKYIEGGMPAVESELERMMGIK